MGEGNPSHKKPRCQICYIITTDTVINIPGTSHIYHPGNYNCDSSNIVYILMFNKCNYGNYVGETSTKFCLRVNNHKRSIRDNHKGLPVAVHYNQTDHSINVSTRRRVPTNWVSGRTLQPPIESVVANSFVPSDFLVDGPVSGLGTVHPLLTLSFVSTWILPLQTDIFQ